MIRSFRGVTPRIDPRAFVLEPCVVAGDVEVGPGASIWFHAVVRGDTGPIRIGARANVQDGVVVHVTTGGTCLIEDDVTIGHGAIIHGAHLKRGCLVGMGASVLDGAVIGEGAMVGANALVPAGMQVPPGHLAIGVPAKVRRPLTPEEVEYVKTSAPHYVEFAEGYR